MTKVSIIIPVYNEEKVIADCLLSINVQSYKNLEIIIVDDGSTDSSIKKVEETRNKFARNLTIFKQKHLGAAAARNLGASKAKGEILVFVDADMTFDKGFLEKLIEPILTRDIIGTFSKEEYISNKDNIWSRCWNINKNLPIDRMHPLNYPNEQMVFRAIKKNEFMKVGGFEPIGYIDDHTLSEKLGEKAVAAPSAVFYHKNPETLCEIFKQARWIGKSEFKRRKIKNENLMRVVTIIRYSLPLSLINGLYKAFRFKLPQFVIFRLLYDFAIEISLVKSFFGEQRYK